jgi:DNA polymerase (family 10)
MAKKKDSTNSSRSAAQLIELLEEVAGLMEIAGENDFKVRAYRKGAAAIGAASDSLEDISSGAVKIAGVGEGLKAAIKEYLESGSIAAKEELSVKIPPAVFELTKVPGLSAKKAILVNSELGVQSIGELEYACRENRLVTLKGFGEALQNKILKGIELLKESEGKLRLDEALEFAERLEKQLRSHLGTKAKVMRVGALARKCEVIERFEFAFTGPATKIADAVGALSWSSSLEEMREKPFETDLAGYRGKLASGHALTLWISETEPDAETIQWLNAAAEVRDEVEINIEEYMDWEPSWLEPEWIEEKRTPTEQTYRRERDGGVKGIFHCHTNFSDGKNTLEEMVRAAEKRGYEYIGISDHSQTAFYAQGLKPERLVEQRRMIDALQKKVSIKIFHGIESDILAEGALDYDDEILNSFDFIVGSVHSRFKMEQEAMTDRLVHALENPHITIWGHPTGRLLLARQGYGLSWEHCLEAAIKNGVAIEINANPHRLDIDWRLGKMLEDMNATVCINPDAHSTEGLDDTRFGEWMAEKAMLPVSSILNRMGVSEMEKYLWERKKQKKKPSSSAARV